ncbi:MAG: hypothetical protein NPIRA03_26240 [Nitrospirales bacterium]|nr:MAG: hypothetical protein NPIRA03_26240 [Nitrospirales bacterium]
MPTPEDQFFESISRLQTYTYHFWCLNNIRVPELAKGGNNIELNRSGATMQNPEMVCFIKT